MYACLDSACTFYMRVTISIKYQIKTKGANFLAEQEQLHHKGQKNMHAYFALDMLSFHTKESEQGM